MGDSKVQQSTICSSNILILLDASTAYNLDWPSARDDLVYYLHIHLSTFIGGTSCLSLLRSLLYVLLTADVYSLIESSYILDHISYLLFPSWNDGSSSNRAEKILLDLSCLGKSLPRQCLIRVLKGDASISQINWVRRNAVCHRGLVNFHSVGGNEWR